MRVAWVQDLNIFTRGGGAQRTDREIVKHGIRKGHEIDLITPENFSQAFGAKYDLVVFSNIHMLMNMDSNRMLMLAEEFPHVMWHHDYFCRYRLFFPMKPKCSRCVYLPSWRRLYNTSVLNLFMSPLHFKAWASVVPELANHAYAFVPSAINPKEYKPGRVVDQEPNTVIGVNCLLPFKGRDNVIRYAEEHPELRFTFVGAKEGNLKLAVHNCRYVGLKTRQELVQLYASHEYFIHLPNTPQPSERTPAEFILANPEGKLIVNDLVGLLSYPNVIRNGKVNREQIIKLVSTSSERFWNEIEKVM